MTTSLKILIADTKIKPQARRSDQTTAKNCQKATRKARKNLLWQRLKTRHVKCGNCLIHSNPGTAITITGPVVSCMKLELTPRDMRQIKTLVGHGKGSLLYKTKKKNGRDNVKGTEKPICILFSL